MARCNVCGNDYDKAFQVTQGGRTMTFDSFECAIQAMAPQCAHCQCRVVGHGIEAHGKVYCCAKSGQLSSRHLLPGSICQHAPELADSWMPGTPAGSPGQASPGMTFHALR